MYVLYIILLYTKLYNYLIISTIYTYYYSIDATTSKSADYTNTNKTQLFHTTTTKKPISPIKIPNNSRLIIPTVATIMRNLDTVQSSPIIKKLQKEIIQADNKTYLFQGSKFMKNIEKFNKNNKKKRKKRVSKQ